MLSFKSKFPFTSILTGLFVALFLIGCGQTGDRQTTVGPGAADNFSSPIPAPLEKLRTGLNAKVIVDGGTPNVRIIDLQVDTQNDRVVGTIPNLPVGPHTFEIQYFIDNILIATAPAVTITIQANADTPVPFDAGALVYPDTDNDGFTNLNEVEIFGSASNAWADPNTKPEVLVVVNPGTAILPQNGVQTFTAAIAQNANQGVTWSVEGGDANGTITPGGTYTAPVTPGTYNVVATSQADPTKSAKITVQVAIPGDLDVSFNTNGIVSTDLGSFSSVSAIAIQADGKTIAVGQSDVDLQNNTQFHFTLARYNTDGSLDTSFGTGGIVKTILGTNSFPSAVAIQSDGKIVVVGQSDVVSQSNTDFHFTLVRYNPADGSLDTSFGTGGIVKTVLGTGSFPSSIVIQTDGKIIAAGNSNVNLQSNTQSHFTLVRYNSANGSLDTSFGTGGIVKTVLGTSSSASSLSIQSDGKIITVGNSDVNLQNNTQRHFTLVRYNPANGSLDSSFGTGGIAKTILGANSFPAALKIQEDGRVVAAGNSSILLGTENHYTLVRYHHTVIPSVLLTANLSGSEEVPAVTTTARGSATFVITPGGPEIFYTLSFPIADLNKITGVQIHLGVPGIAGRPLFTLPISSLVSPLTGKITASDLDPTAVLAGVDTFAEAIKQMLDGNTNIHIHTLVNQSGEVRGQILVPPPTLSKLQAEIFSPKCATCHNPSGGTGGATANLFLDSRQTSFENLVNVQSTEAPSLKRVEPGNPGASYLIHKLEGTAVPEGGRCCPDRMPPGGPFLSAEEIKLTRDWISGGAKND